MAANPPKVLRACDAFELEWVYEHSPLGLALLDGELRYVRVNEKLAAMNGRPAAEHIGRTPREIIPHLAPSVEVLCRRVLESGLPVLDVVMTGKPYAGPDAERGWLASYSPVRAEDARVAGVSVTVVEMAGLSQRASELEQRLRFQELIAELSAAFVNIAPEEVDGQINFWIQRLAEHLGADRSNFFQLSEDGTGYRLSHKWAAPGVKGLPSTLLPSHLPWATDWILRQGRILRLNRLEDLPADALTDRETFRRYGPKSNITVPLRVAGKVFGALAIGSVRQERAWSDEAVVQVQVAGQVFANALARKRATEEVRRASAEVQSLKGQLEQDIRDRQRAEEALRSSRSSLELLAGRLLTVQEEERRLLARELHDDLTQRLAVLAIELGRVEGKQGSRCRECTAKLAGIRGELAKLSEDIHAISRQLHPSILDDLGLVDALQSECSAISDREGITISCRIQDVPLSVPREAALCVYRIAQEGLRNVAKHARVKEAEVALRGEDGALVLTVRDAGVGFDVGEGSRTVGIASMAERARLVQGEFAIESRPGKGTVVRASIPLGRSEA